MEHRMGGSFAYRVCKRVFDIFFSAFVLAVGFIPALILSVFIAKDTGGFPIYSQERVGKGGRVFRIYKFRTMVADSDDIEKYLDAEQLAQWHCERKVVGDPRITPLGRKLRSTSIDEVPNFINVLKSEIPLRRLKTRLEFSEKSMGAFALLAKSSTSKGKVFSQVASCFVSGLRTRRISGLNCNCISGMETQLLAKPVFGVSPVHSGALFQKSNNELAKAAW